MRLAAILVAAVTVAGVATWAYDRPQASVLAAPADTTFAGLVDALSENGGYFDTDNLISNESSYLHAAGALDEYARAGGAYIGVGPDQNFSYIAIAKPAVAFIIDIRRDNLLQHLFFKALFVQADDRLEYLCLLLARVCGDDAASGIDAILAVVDSAAVDLDAARSRIEPVLNSFGVPLDEQDLEVIRSIHARFAASGLELQFESHGRAPRPYYPTLRRLILETDLDGRRRNYLADADAFEYVRGMQLTDRIIPVVGNLAGDHALRAIGAEIARRGLVLSVFYASNVEAYLMQDGTFDEFIGNVDVLPDDGGALIVRSFFHNAGVLPTSVAGYASTQIVQRISDLRAEERRRPHASYHDLVTRAPLPRS